MPPKKRSRAGSLNYTRRKDIKLTGEADESNIENIEMGSGEVRVRSGEVEVGSGEVRVRVGSGEVEVGSGEVRVWVGSGETTVEAESSGELMVGAESEQERGNSDDEYDPTMKRVKIDDVCAMAAEPLNEWLNNLHRDDVQHIALLLYANISKEFSLQKTNTASVVASFLHKNERTIRRWIDDFVSNDGDSLIHNRVTMLETRH